MPSSGQVWFVKDITDLWVLSDMSLIVFSNSVRIKLHTENQLPSLLNSAYSPEEDLEIRILKTTSTTFPIFLNISSGLVKIKLHTKISPQSCLILYIPQLD